MLNFLRLEKLKTIHVQKNGQSGTGLNPAFYLSVREFSIVQQVLNQVGCGLGLCVWYWNSPISYNVSLPN